MHNWPSKVILFVLIHSFAFSSLALALDRNYALALENGKRVNQVLLKAKANMDAWLKYQDPESGLLPKYLPSHHAYDPKKPLYMVKDTAADLYPFLVLTSYFIDRNLFNGYMYEFLRNEVRLTTGADGLPRDAFFNPFRIDEKTLDYNIFGASEYTKDGLTPVVELLGITPWYYRMVDLVNAVYDNAPIQTNFGKLPSGSAEVNGEMLQTLCRLYGITGDEKYLKLAECIGDAYYFEVMVLNNGLPSHHWDFTKHTGQDLLNLRDHGCEIIAGLALLFAIEHDEGRERAITYYLPIKNMLDKIETTLNEDGQFPNRIKCSDLSIIKGPLNDNWGYLYTAWWDFYLVTGEDRYKSAIQHALSSIPKYRNASWERLPADGYADSIEGALQMLNRIPIEKAFDWVDSEIDVMLGFQQKEGYIESWYGDGNWNRTVLMYALWKTQGCYLKDWHKDVYLGATSKGDSLIVAINAKKKWEGRLCFDQPRHKTIFQFKQNYARINEFPEWFVAEPTKLYHVWDSRTKRTEIRIGSELLRGLPISLQKNEELFLVVVPNE